MAYSGPSPADRERDTVIGHLLDDGHALRRAAGLPVDGTLPGDIADPGPDRVVSR